MGANKVIVCHLTNLLVPTEADIGSWLVENALERVIGGGPSKRKRR